MSGGEARARDTTSPQEKKKCLPPVRHTRPPIMAIRNVGPTCPPASKRAKETRLALMGSDTARIAGVPSSLLSTPSASQAVTTTPTTHMPADKTMGFAVLGRTNMSNRVAAAAAASPGPVLNGSFG